jgi:hypothetical protein
VPASSTRMEPSEYDRMSRLDGLDPIGDVQPMIFQLQLLTSILLHIRRKFSQALGEQHPMSSRILILPERSRDGHKLLVSTGFDLHDDPTHPLRGGLRLSEQPRRIYLPEPDRPPTSAQGSSSY